MDTKNSQKNKKNGKTAILLSTYRMSPPFFLKDLRDEQRGNGPLKE